MRHRRIGLIFIVMHFLLAAIPCSAVQPTPAGGVPEVQFANLPDIVLPPVVYTGPVLDDIGMKPIFYSGPDLSDITLDPIHFSKATLEVKPAANLSHGSITAVKTATRIPGTTPGVKIVSPKPGQTVAGSVLLEVEVTGWQGIPGVDLSWWWSAPTPAGQWPPPPKSMTVVERLNGKTRIVIPAAAFPSSGLWRVEATVKVSDKLRVADDVSFKLAGNLIPQGKTAIIKQPAKQTLPGTAVTKPAASGRIQRRPVGPAVSTVKK